MTLILALGNNEQVIQISDRRLSCNGRLIDDESSKCGVLYCLNARMAFGYTGLAKWQDFSTPKWLFSALHASAPPEFTIVEILKRLKIKATETFKHDPSLKRIPKAHKRLSVMFSGFIDFDGGTMSGCSILSNFQNIKNNTSLSEAADEFEIYFSPTNTDVRNPTIVQGVGNYHAILDQDINEMKDMLLRSKPNQAIVGKALEIVRDIADRPGSTGTIGKQLTAISVPKDRRISVSNSYSTEYVKPETFKPAMVCLKPEQYMVVDNISVKPVDDDTAPLSVPKVSKNAPCPCGSNKKYKRCHGRISRRKSGIAIEVRGNSGTR